jgi:lipopolysaccharide export system protein LptA
MPRILYILVFVFCSKIGLSQGALFSFNTNPSDSLKRIDILKYTGDYRYKKIDSATNLIMLAGNVKLKQANTYFFCDSLVINTNTGVMEAFGNIHINESDTVHSYSQYLKYYSKTRKAELRRGVRIISKTSSLFNEAFDYDMATHVGNYNVPSRIESGKSVINSNKGIFYLDTKDIYLYQNVKVKDPKYGINTDTLLFNSNSQIARFVSLTNINLGKDRYIKTTNGYYNAKTGQASFSERPFIKDGDNEIEANNVTQDEYGNSQASGNVIIKDLKNEVVILAEQTATDKKNGTKQASGNVVLIDKKNGLTVLAGNIFQNEQKDAFLATQFPVLIIVKDKDSTVLTADTLFGARLSDLKYFTPLYANTHDTVVPKPINVSKLNPKDSSNRYFEAYRNVRIHHDSLQLIGDSCMYTLLDSTFRVFGNPIAWSKENQIKGDTMYLFTQNQKAKRIQVFENSFVVNKLKQDYYNQIKSNRLNGYFNDGQLYYMRAKGSAESIYVAQDQDSAFVAFNKVLCDIIDMRFANSELEKIIMINEVSGKLSPPNQVPQEERYLRNFSWQENLRPKTKWELFERFFTGATPKNIVEAQLQNNTITLPTKNN